MNKRQKEVLQHQFDSEKAVLERLEKQYQTALNDINRKIRILQSDDMTQSKIYRLEYQKALKKQVESILEKLHGDEFSTIQEYLSACYTDGFIGTMYDIAGQGIPLVLPIDQEAAVTAILTDSKISEGLYTALGVDTTALKKAISAEVTRGIATGMSYADIARNISNVSKAPLSRAKTIARTEGHRIQQESTRDAQQGAKSKGADVVKQWDSTLDGKTRPSHKKVDGEIRELDERFSNGLDFPGDPSGKAGEVVNCRCVSLSRARWALDEDELNTLKERAAFFELDKAKTFEDFKAKYLKAASSVPEKIRGQFVPAKTIQEAEEYAKKKGVKYADYSKLPLATANELNKALDTLPDDVKPVFVGASTTLEQYWGGNLPRSSKNYYGVTVDTFNGIHLGFGKGIDFDTHGQMVGISSSYKTADKITAAKLASQAKYQQKYGRKWYFNETGNTTPYHEMGHVYANTKGLPDGFEAAAAKWAEEAKCDMLKKPSEAWAEAWAAYHTENKDLPDYIRTYIEAASSAKNSGKMAKNSLIAFDDDAIIKSKIEVFAKDLRDGKVQTKISPQKQARHIFGTKEYTASAEKRAKTGDKPSYLREDLTIEDLSEIVKDKLGTGIIEVKGDDSFQEFFDCDEIIGYCFSKSDGEYKPTKRVQVKYALGDGNIHIIPVRGKS